MKIRFAPVGVQAVCDFQRLRQWLLWTVLIGGTISGRAASSVAEPDSETTWALKVLAARKTEQLEAAKQFKAFYDFQFTNEVQRSGITFTNHIVDDCGSDLKAIIYDHGTGVVAADVDGDGKIDIFFP